jgi:hypothetical protein
MVPKVLWCTTVAGMGLFALLWRLLEELQTSRQGQLGEISTLSMMPGDAFLGLLTMTLELQCNEEQQQTN